MPYIRKSIIFTICIIILSLLVVGCGSEDPTELTQEDLELIMDDAVTATTEADSFAMNMDMNLSADVNGDEESRLSATMTGEGAIDVANEAMKMNMNVSFSLDMGIFNMSMEDIEIEMYQLDDWQYQHMSIPDMEDEWTKMPATHDDADLMDPDYLKDQIDLLKSSAELEGLRMEKVNEVECYVIKVTPDAQKIADWISGQSMMTEQIPADELQQLEDLMENIDIMVWISKDSNYLMKFSLDATIDTSELETDSTPMEAAENAVITASMTMTMSDYNESIDITLPAEAADARETTPEGIFGEDFGDLFMEDMFGSEGFEGMFDEEDFNPDEFSDIFGDEGFDIEQFEGMFGDMDMEQFNELFGDLDMEELSELLEDENIDLEELAKLIEDLDVSFEEY